jgi:hypothetical protein
MSAESFIARCLQGEILTEEIDDWVEQWHQSDCEYSLFEYLGMTDEEYNAWLLDDTILPYIIKARKDGLPLETVVEQGIERIAARNQTSREVTQVLSWLNKHAV